ncbi:MAG: Ku protein [Vicinamibacterales bacterium]
MARAIWKGQLSFGLVSMPVELHTAVREARPRFRLLHATDMSPVSMERVCQHEGKPVEWDDLVKGYEIEPGRFVAITEDDFRTVALERSPNIAILDFVTVDDIDDRFFDVPYLLAPGKGAEHTYVLLRDALRKTGRAGIAKYVMRTRQHLAAVQVVDDRLVLTTMRFADELVDPQSVIGELPKTAPDKREVDLAVKLVEGLARDWDPSAYTDDYTSALLSLIERKADGEEVEEAPAAPAPKSTKVVNLMDRLRESLAQAEARGSAGRKPARPGKTSARTRAGHKAKTSRTARSRKAKSTRSASKRRSA